MPLQIDPQIARADARCLVLNFSSEKNIACVLVSEINARLHAGEILRLEGEIAQSSSGVLGTVKQLLPKTGDLRLSLTKAISCFGSSRRVDASGAVSIVVSPLHAVKIADELEMIAQLAVRGIWLTQHKCSSKQLGEAAAEICQSIQNQMNWFVNAPNSPSPFADLR